MKMSKIIITESDRNHILSLYELNENSVLLNEKKGVRKLAKDFANKFAGGGIQGMVFKSDAIKKIIQNKEGYVYDSNQPSRKLVFMNGDDFINQLRFTMDNMDATAMHVFMRQNDPNYMSEYIFNVLIPKYEKTKSDNTLSLIKRLLDDYLKNNELMGTGEFPRIRGQFERVLNVLNSPDFKNAGTSTAKSRMLRGTIPNIDSNLGKFLDNMPDFTKEFRQTLRFIADRKKTVSEIKQDLDRIIQNSIEGSSARDAKRLLEKLNVLEVKENNAANAFYQEIMRNKTVPDVLRENLRDVVEVRGIKAVWDIGSSGKPGSAWASAAADVTDTLQVISMIFNKKTWWEGLKRAMSNILAYGINGNLATLRSLNTKIIQSSSAGMGVTLTLLRTAITTITTPIITSGLIYLYDVIKLVAQYAGYDVEKLWEEEEESWWQWAWKILANQLSSASEGGLMAYMPVLRGPMTKFLKCYINGGGTECVRKVIDGITEESIEGSEAEVVVYQNTPESFESYLRDKDIIYSKVGEGDDEGTYWHRNRGDGTPGSGQKYWWEFNGTDFICDNDEFNN
jgi:hypothetical protein